MTRSAAINGNETRRFYWCHIGVYQTWMIQRSQWLDRIQSCPDLVSAHKIRDAIPRSVLESDTYTCNKLIEMFGAFGGLGDARAIFDSMASISKDGFSWALMLHAYNRNGFLREARDLFDQRPCWDLVSWTTMLVALAQRGQLEDAKRFFNRMPCTNLVAWTTMLAAYGRHGFLDQALEIFAAMPQRNTNSWNSMLAALARNSSLDQIAQIFNQMPEWDQISLNTLLVALAERGHIVDAASIFHSIPERNLVTWTAMLHVYARKGQTKNAHDTFHSMPEWNLVSWTAMLSAYARAGDVEGARRIFDEMPATNLVAWNAMLAAYGHYGDVRTAESLFANMPARDRVSFSTMVWTYGWNRNLPRARSMFAALDEVERDAIAWNSILAACVIAGDFEGAHCAMESMPTPNLVAWNALLGGIAHHSSDRARRFFESMPQRDAVSWNSLLVAYALEGRARSVELGSMRAPERSQVTWNTLLAAYAQSAQTLEEAREVFLAMKILAVADDNPACFVAVLAGFNHGGEIRAARRCFLAMRGDFAIAPGKQHYGCIAAVLGRAGQLEALCDLVENMPFVPDALEWKCVLAACKSRDDLERARRKLPEFLAGKT